MDKWILRDAERYASAHRRKQRWYQVMTCLAAVVVFCTTYALILPAITLEKQCQIPEHTHTDSCYTQVTSREKRSLNCTVKADTVIHHHDSACYDADNHLLCTLSEVEAHQHTDTCCIQPEAHTHTDECYTMERGKLICTQSTEPTHVHTDDCYTETSSLVCEEDHEHTESCYAITRELTCGQTEEPAHVHTDDCYAWNKVLSCGLSTEPGAPVLACGKEEVILHTHEPYENEENPGCYDADGNLICGRTEVLEHQHTDACFETVEEPVDTEALTCTLPEDETHTHGTRCYGTWELTCGMEEHTHSDSCVSDEPEPAEPGVYTYQDDTLEALVVLPEECDLPENAVLQVTALTEESERCVGLADQAAEAAGGDVEQVLLYDIGFYAENEAGELQHLDVTDSATVSLLLRYAVLPETPDSVSVLHFAGDSQPPVRLENVTVSQQEAALYALTDEEEAESGTVLTFETEGFSVFAVVRIAENHSFESISPDVAELDGKSFVIKSNGNRYAILARQRNGSADKLDFTNDDTEASFWTFTSVGADTFHISSGGQYMKMANDGALTLTTDHNDATAFTVALSTTVNNDGKHITVSYNGHYINSHGGEGALQGFRGYNNLDAGSTLLLCQKTGTTVNDLDGQSFAIVNQAVAPNAMTTETFPCEEWGLRVPGLKAADVTLVTGSNGVTYVSGSNIAEWTFHAVAGSEGVYTISTVVGEETRYLRYLQYCYSNTTDRGSVTLDAAEENASQISVVRVENGDGKVFLRRQDGGQLNRAGEGKGFWATHIGNDGANSQMLLCKKTSDSTGLFYDLHSPESGNWINAPSISAAFQEVGAGGATLPTVANGNAVGSFVFNSLRAGARSDAVGFYNNQNDARAAAGTLTADNYLAPGREYRFDGWQAVVHEEAGDITYTFPEGATASLAEDGSITIPDTAGTPRTLPGGTVLTGKWSMRSDVVLFFVNFGDTMLEQQNHKPITNFQKEHYTDDIVIGHIYNPTTISVDDGKGHNVIKKENDETIQAEISPIYNPNNGGTQIVIDAVRVFPDNPTSGSAAVYTPFSGINQAAVETKVGDYIRANPDKSTQIKIENVRVDQEKITANNYKLYWYLQKNVDNNDGWHIDGVLVAKTQEMEVYKTFSGLPDQSELMAGTDDSQNANSRFKYRLGLIQSTGDIEYITMNTEDMTGVYAYDGKQGDSQIYKWTLNAIQQQPYTLTEQNYAKDGYDCSTLISVHYSNGDVKWINNTVSTWQSSPAEGNANNGTDLFANKYGDDHAITGGNATSVIFANFYTPTGTGMLSICKETPDGTKLAGAQFVLKNQAGQFYKYNDTEENPTVQWVANLADATIRTTNTNGSAFFGALEVGTYTLEETAAPSGYVKTGHTWTVNVTKNGSTVTVTVTEKDEQGNSVGNAFTAYETGSGISNYVIVNQPVDETLTITKHFTGLTAAQMARIYRSSYQNAPSPYCIEVSDGTGDPIPCYLSIATQLTGGNSYSWTLTGLQGGKTYTITEKNYRIPDYLDTVVSGTFTRKETQEDNTVNTITTDLSVTKNTSGEQTASVSVTKTAFADSVDITNTYTNTFTVRLTKVNSFTGEALSGAVFKIYGDFNESTNTSDQVTYTENGVTQTAYYIGQTVETDQNGIASYGPLKLSSQEKTFVYVIDELTAPSGYIKLDEPIVTHVTIRSDGSVEGGNYKNGVLKLSIPNTRKTDATAKVTATKIWEGYESGSKPDVTLTLYRTEGEGTAANQIDTVTLNGTPQSDSTITVDGSKTVTVKNTGWVVTWSGLPAYKDENTMYNYYVAETLIAGFATSYNTEAKTLTVDSSSVSAALAAGTETVRSVTVTNTAGYELPDTGGAGTMSYTAGGALLFTSAALLLLNIYSKRKKENSPSS